MGKTPRLYLSPERFGEHSVALDGESAHYLKRVLRLRPGDHFAAMDGAARAWLCALGREQTAEFVEEFAAVPPLPLKLTAAVALCKGSRFESTIEKLAELGVASLIPLHTERTERKDPSPAKLERWTQIAESASALAYRLQPMKVTAPQDIAPLMNSLEGPSLFCHPGGSQPLRAFLSQADTLTLLIGPEGGFSTTEVKLLSGKANPVDLGPLNLRVETAATLAAGMALRLHGAQE